MENWVRRRKNPSRKKLRDKADLNEIFGILPVERGEDGCIGRFYDIIDRIKKLQSRHYGAVMNRENRIYREKVEEVFRLKNRERTQEEHEKMN